jgi:invasion protein IalB
VVLIEPPDGTKKILRVAVPSPLQLAYGARIVIDQNQPLRERSLACYSNVCMADYEATPDLVAALKQGRRLTVRAITDAGEQLKFVFPLAGFAAANEGPPTDPKTFDERQQELEEYRRWLGRKVL